MTKIESIQDLRDWVQEEGYKRSAKVEVNKQTDYEEKVWVYDYKLQDGQHINIPGKITLYEEAEERMEKEIEAIKRRMAMLGDDNEN